MGFDVVCVGAVTLDTIVRVSEYPAEDSRSVAQQVTEAGGGPAATAAVTMARLGLSVALCGSVGDDPAGKRVRSGIEAEGVDTRWLDTRADAATAVSTVVVAPVGSRTIITRPGAVPRPSSEVVDSAGWIHVDQLGYQPVRQLLPELLGGPRISLDGGNAVPGLELGGLDLYAPTLHQLRHRYPTASTAEQLLVAACREGADLVVATDGDRGSHVRCGAAGGSSTDVPAFAVDVVSTLGAGDVFHGALLAGLVRGLDAVAATTLAAATAALSCRALDGRSAVPALDEVQRFLLDHPHRTEVSHAS